MSPTRRQASHTLPRNFIFHYNDGLPPRTPEPHQTGVPQPPSPPRQPYRLRRPRVARQLSSDYFGVSGSRDVPIPTIEVSDPVMEDEPVHPTVPTVSLSLATTRPSPPPRTPTAQVYESTTPIQDSIMNNTDDIVDTCSQGESISRPSTACSGFSDSSVSSSLESFPSLGGSFTSPESEVFEKKAAEDLVDQRNLHLRPSAVSYPHNDLPAKPTKPKMKWTEEMDNHLWMTYMRYLQDPTHTPFKMLPGTAPPLGVCSRVVREAKRTWKASRNANFRKFTPWNADSPDTIRPVNSGGSTPTEVQAGKPIVAWPRSDSATRRRLRELCKRKPTLSAHYNRLLTARSPSPFLNPSSARSRSSSAQPHISVGYNFHPTPQPSSFSTRDMGVSLLASTSSAVSALNQLTEQSQTPLQPIHNLPSSAGRTHQKSQSLQLDSFQQSQSRLASPFQPIPKNRPEQSFQPPPSLDVPVAPAPRLASPVQIIAPVPQGSLRLGKRRGETLLTHLGMNSNADMDSDHSSVIPGISARRVRARGFSLGDVSESSRRLTRIFEPTEPTTISRESLTLSNTHIMTDNPGNSSSLMPPFLPNSVRRLGSPFSEKPKPLFNTFPRNFSLHGLEPTMETQEERIAEPNFLPPFTENINMTEH
jgi:hypothetical protein